MSVHCVTTAANSGDRCRRFIFFHISCVLFLPLLINAAFVRNSWGAVIMNLSAKYIWEYALHKPMICSLREDAAAIAYTCLSPAILYADLMDYILYSAESKKKVYHYIY